MGRANGQLGASGTWFDIAISRRGYSATMYADTTELAQPDVDICDWLEANLPDVTCQFRRDLDEYPPLT